mgnify:CR=1 FL=1
MIIFHLLNFSEEEADEERPADIIAEIDAEETLEEHENKEPEESANASDTDDTDGSSNTAINKATDFFIKFTFDLPYKDRRLCLNGVYWCQKER